MKNAPSLPAFVTLLAVLGSLCLAQPSRALDWGAPFGFLAAPPRPSEYADVGNQWVTGGGMSWWKKVETTPGVYNWSAISLPSLTELQQMDALGIRVILELRSVNPIYGTSFDVDEYPDGNVAAWESFVTALVEKFDGDGVDDLPGAPTIKIYQFLNELTPSGVNYWTDHPDQYAEMFDATYRAMKAACPDCVLFLPGANLQHFQFQDEGAPADGWVVRVLRYLDGYATQFDDMGFDYHIWSNTASQTDPYSEGTDYRRHKTLVDAIRHAYQRFGYLDQPIIGGQLGMPGIGPGESNRSGQPLRANEPYQGRYVAKLYALTASLGQKVSAWAVIVERASTDPTSEMFLHMGLIHNPTNNGGLSHRKLGWYTYKKMTQSLAGANWGNVIMVVDGTDNVYVYRFDVAGAPVYIAWWDYFNDPGYTAGDTKAVTLTGFSGTEVTVTDLTPDYADGSQVTNYATAFTVTNQPISGGSAAILLGEGPVLVEEAFVRLTPEGFLTNGQFRIQLTGTPGETCVLQVSSNLLAAWTGALTNTLTNGVWLFVDSDATNFNRRFYRAMLSP